MHPLGSILRKYIKDVDLVSVRKLSNIKRRWKDIVGHTISSHTSPYILRDGVLMITVDTPQWLHHLGFFKEEIKNKVKEYNVNRIHFLLGSLPDRHKDEEEKEEMPLSDDDTRYIDNTLISVRDGELKKQLRTLLIHALTKGHKK